MSPAAIRSPRPRWGARLAAALLLALGAPGALAAQHEGHDGHGEADRPRAVTAAWGARAVGVATHVTPAILGESRTEGYLTQPVLGADLDLGGGRLRLSGMLNLEALTLRRGELNAGIWGEGYVDRRHPHTVLHEAMATARLAGGPRRAAEVTLAAGRGFAPFGTDDPMARPFVKFPVNHHLAQVLERLVAIAALRGGPVTLEAGLFNGDEPEGTAHLGTPRRFGDSWAARATLAPRAGVEASASFAAVESPEFAAGSGLDQRKWSAAVRYGAERAGGGEYLLLEWARTDELANGRRSFDLASWLAEAEVRRGAVAAALRLERTDRPEEERLADPFRSPRPHADANILGITRWDGASARVERGSRWGALRAAPFVEVSRHRAVQTLRPSVFVPAEFYGAERMWSVSAGVRLGAGTAHPRMGRYGAAAAGHH